MDNKKQQAQIKNLIMLAGADGKVTQDELMLIASVASREKLTQEQFDALLEYPSSIPFVLPEDEETKKRYLTDMVALMTIDGEMDDNELALCKVYANFLGYTSDIVEKLVIDIADCLVK